MIRGREATHRVAGCVVAALAAALVAVLTMAVPTAAQAPTTLDGSVVYQNGPAVGLTVDLFEMGADGSRSSWIGDTSTGSDGTYGFEVEPACYVLVAIAPEGRRFSTSRWKEIPVCVEGPTVVPPAQIQGDRPDLPGAAGTVRWTGGGPAAGVVVDLFEGPRSENRYLASTTTDVDGRYDFAVDDPEVCYAVTIIAPDGAMFADGSRWHNGGNCVGGLDALLADPDPQPGSCPFPVASDTWFSVVDESKVDLVRSDGRINVQHHGAALFDPVTGGVQQSGIGMWFLGQYDGIDYFRSGFEIYTYDWETGAREEVDLVPGGDPFVHRPLLTASGVIAYEGYATADNPTFGNVIHDIDTGTTTFLAPFGTLGTALGHDADADRVDFSRLASYFVAEDRLVEHELPTPPASGPYRSGLTSQYEDGRYTLVTITDRATVFRWTFDFGTEQVESIGGVLPVDGYTRISAGTSPTVALDLANQRLFFYGIATEGPNRIGISEPILWEMSLPNADGDDVPVRPIGLQADDNPLVQMTIADDGRLHLAAFGSLWTFDPSADDLTEYSGCVTPWSIAEVDGVVYLAALRDDGTSAAFRID